MFKWPAQHHNRSFSYTVRQLPSFPRLHSLPSKTWVTSVILVANLSQDPIPILHALCIALQCYDYDITNDGRRTIVFAPGIRVIRSRIELLQNPVQSIPGVVTTHAPGFSIKETSRESNLPAC
jgi:hypothetical protein